MNPTVQDALMRLREAIRSATRHLVEREQLAELMVLGAVAQEHLLVVGPPGTGKSAVVRRIAASLGGNYFEYLLGRFTEPSELFGPVNLGKLREGRVETDIAGMHARVLADILLPDADGAQAVLHNGHLLAWDRLGRLADLDLATSASRMLTFG